MRRYTTFSQSTIVVEPAAEGLASAGNIVATA